MFDILCFTDNELCGGDLPARVEKIAAAGVAGIVLRAKELAAAEYEQLARQVLAICRRHETPCILHGFAEVAARLDCAALHLPLPVLRSLDNEMKKNLQTLGASCHSVTEAIEAEKLGCTYITAGHIFATDCKKGLPGRGLDFLREVCGAVNIPVYAIGGINKENIAAVRAAGAAGACVMSGLMTCERPDVYLAALREVCDEIQ